MNSKIAALLAIASVATAQTLYQTAELEALLDDLDTNLSSYIALYTSGQISFADLPSGVLELAMALMSATDSSYTTLFADIDYAGVESMITQLSWYSSDLLPKIESIYAAEGGVLSSSAAATSAAAETSAAVTSAGSSSVVTAAAETSAAVTSAGSSSVVTAASYSNHTSSQKANATSTSTTAAFQVATTNGAAKAVFGMGAGALAAAALLM